MKEKFSLSQENAINMFMVFGMMLKAVEHAAVIDISMLFSREDKRQYNRARTEIDRLIRMFSAKFPKAAEEEGIQYFKRRLKLKSIDEQRYYVPEDKFDLSKVEARFNDGLLRVVIPAREEEKEKDGIKVRIVTEEEKKSKTGGSTMSGRTTGKSSASGSSAKNQQAK